MPVRLAIHGAAGRMGQRLVALASADPMLSVAAALESPQHPRIGQDAGLIAGVGSLGVPLASSLLTPVDVVIDFSIPGGTMAITRNCVERKLPLVVATTGLDASQTDVLRQAAETIPLLWSPSMSLAVNLLMKLSAITGRALKDHPTGADVEIIERHHRFKEDAPSGTALKFGELIAREMGQSAATHGREGRPGQRPHGEIGYHAVRSGDNPGEHTIIFGLLGETIELAVKASSRDCYAHGALFGRPISGWQTAWDVWDGRCAGNPLMAKCEQGYLCDVCGRDVEEITDSNLYLRYVIGQIDPETLHTTQERHICCHPTLAQFIVDERFPAVVVEGPFDKRQLDPAYVRQQEQTVTRGWRRLREIAGQELTILEYPLPEVRARLEQEANSVGGDLPKPKCG